jgi:hypothetical protein
MAGCVAAKGALGWSEIKQKHFIIYYTDNRLFAQRVGYKAEEYYTTISSDLGFTRHDGFWLWDNRAKIYIYSSRSDFAKATGAPEWAAGKANPEQRLIATYQGSKEFIDSLLPHEMTHLIFMEFIGFNKSIPLWLNEGIAQWEDKLQRDKAMVLVKRLYALNRLMPLAQLMKLDVRTVSDTGEAVIFYAQSASLVGFMIKTYGPERFRKFCGQLRDGKSINEALRFTYSMEISTIGSLEKLWYGYLKEMK